MSSRYPGHLALAQNRTSHRRKNQGAACFVRQRATAPTLPTWSHHTCGISKRETERQCSAAAKCTNPTAGVQPNAHNGFACARDASESCARPPTIALFDQGLE